MNRNERKNLGHAAQALADTHPGGYHYMPVVITIHAVKPVDGMLRPGQIKRAFLVDAWDFAALKDGLKAFGCARDETHRVVEPTA